MTKKNNTLGIIDANGYCKNSSREIHRMID